MSLLEQLQNTLARLETKAGAEIKELSGDIMADIDRALAKAHAEASEFADKLKAAVAQNPEPVFAILRKIKPILLVKNVAVVTRFEDVQEVLSRDDVFHVTYTEKMEVVTGGRNFFLGMQNSPEYERDVAHMRSAMRREDVASIIVPIVAEAARQLVAASDGTVDVVALSRTVPARLVAKYFGCPPPSDQELADWGTILFQYLFTDLNNDPAVGAAARQAAQRTREWLDDTIAARKSHPGGDDDVLGRCLAMQKIGLPGMDDLGIRNNLLGLLVGAIPTTSKCCAQALDQLLDRPAELAGAQAAAAAGDDALLAQYIFEALRFNPNNPGVFRTAAEDYTVARGHLRSVTIPKGASVIAATQSAMFDDSKVDRPNEFRTDRPPYVYMHWGYGLHACFGQYINQIQIPGILKPLLASGSVRRAPGDEGKLQYAGPFPSSLKVAIAARASAA
jgi:cytochrome P450